MEHGPNVADVVGEPRGGRASFEDRYVVLEFTPKGKAPVLAASNINEPAR